VDGLRGDPQPTRGEGVAQKVKSSLDPADERLVGMLLDPQFLQGLVHDPDGATQFQRVAAWMTQSSLKRT
jgi:hypothetical protein